MKIFINTLFKTSMPDNDTRLKRYEEQKISVTLRLWRIKCPKFSSIREEL